MDRESDAIQKELDFLKSETRIEERNYSKCPFF